MYCKPGGTLTGTCCGGAIQPSADKNTDKNKNTRNSWKFKHSTYRLVQIVPVQGLVAVQLAAKEHIRQLQEDNQLAEDTVADSSFRQFVVDLRTK